MATYRGRRTQEGTEVTVDGEPLYLGREVRDHSVGAEWGYSGSGPAQLALAILLHHYKGGVEEALYAYQRFKVRVIAKLEGNEWELDSEAVEEVLSQISKRSAHMTKMVKSFEWAAASEQGSRRKQEDRHAIFESKPHKILIASVLDGVGGHPNGAQAAEAAAQVLHKPGSVWEDPPNLLSNLYHQANVRVRATEGLTCALTLMLDDNDAWVANDGDCSLFRIRKGKLEDLSYKERSDRHSLTSCLGERTCTPRIWHLATGVHPGELYILATDGIGDNLAPERIWTICKEELSLESAAKRLAWEAAALPNSDNSTCVLIRAS